MAVNSVRHSFLCNNSGLKNLLHGVISLPDATSYNNFSYHLFILISEIQLNLVKFKVIGTRVFFLIVSKVLIIERQT